MAGRNEDLLNCTICMDGFTRPKALPCLHTFCEECIREYGGSSPGLQFACPICRAATTIPQGGVAAFPNNFYIVNFQEALQFVPNPNSPSPPPQPTAPIPQPTEPFPQPIEPFPQPTAPIPQPTAPIRQHVEPSAPPPVQRSLSISAKDHPVPVRRNANGAQLVFGKNGNGLTNFTHPVALTNFRDKYIIISDQRGNRIMLFDMQGRINLMFTCSGSIHGLCIDASAHILVANSRAAPALAKCYNIKGHSRGSFGNRFNHENPHGIAASRDYIAVSSLTTNRVFLLDKTGRLIREIGGTGSRKNQFRQPLYMFFNSSADLIVSDCDNHAVKVFSTNSTSPKVVIGSSEGSSNNKLCRPLGVTSDIRGNIYVCDSGNHRVQCFDQSGKFIATVVSDIYGESYRDDAVPRDIAMFGTSTLAVLVTGFSFNEVRIFRFQAQSALCALL